MSLMGYRQYARHRGCALYAVQRAITTGRLQVVDGKIDSEAADRDWSANTDASKCHTPAQPAAPAEPAPLPLLEGRPTVQAPPMEPSEALRGIVLPSPQAAMPPKVKSSVSHAAATIVVLDGNLVQARTASEWARARKAQLELERAEGRLVEAETARSTYLKAARIWNAACEGVPTPVSVKLVSKTDPNEIADIVRAEIRAAMQRAAEEISSRFPEFTQDVSERNDSEDRAVSR